MSKTFLKIIFILFSLIIISVIGGFIGWWYTSDTSYSHEVLVPRVEKMMLDDAAKKLMSSKLNYEKVYVYDENYPKGTVITQNPIPGEKVKTGRKIRLSVSMGIIQSNMPDFVGKTLIEAKNIIRNFGADMHVRGMLRLENIVSVYDNQIPSGYIIAQFPAAGAEIEKGQKVGIVVSKGTELKRFLMPDLTGLTVEQAKDILNNIESNIKITKRSIPNAIPGRIVSQLPNFGKWVRQGQTIILNVSEEFENDNSLKRTILPFIAPIDGRNHRVRIIIQDKTGRREIANRSLDSGEKIDITIDYYPGSTMYIFLDNRLYREEEL